MQGPKQSAYRSKLTSEINRRVQELNRDHMDAALGDISHAATNQGTRIEAVNQKFRALRAAFQEVDSSLSEVTDGHQDLHESIDDAVTIHQASNNVASNMSHLMEIQCETAVTEAQQHARVEE